MRGSITEKQIETSILQYLTTRGIFCYKQNTVGIFDQARNCYRKPNSKYIISGIADIIGIYRSAFLAIEVKTPKRKNNLTIAQKNFIETVNHNGGIAFVATSINDVVEQLDQAS